VRRSFARACELEEKVLGPDTGADARAVAPDHDLRVAPPGRCPWVDPARNVPGSEQRLNDALDALAEGAYKRRLRSPVTANTTNVRESTISFAQISRTPDDDDVSARDSQASDQDENSGRCGGHCGVTFLDFWTACFEILGLR
jgi:hypothetical protein